MDPYQPCPCGSGKSFKWCCQAYYVQVEKARDQFNQGQRETALRTIQNLVEQNPGSAPVLGYQAELLYMDQKPDAADEAIQKAFAISPDFPFGHWLRGIMRKDEGELKGALIEFRKAAELYHPKANAVLAEINAAIFDIEMRMNRPIAAHAAIERAVHHDPAAEQLRDVSARLFSVESRLPECARKVYAFRGADVKNADAWKTALPAGEHSSFREARAAFEKLTEQDSSDAPAWFNLGLVRAWLGDNPAAIEALQKSVELEQDMDRAAEAGALIEVLRCGDGMERESDYLEYRFLCRIRQAKAVVSLLEEWQRNNRLSGLRTDQENGTLNAMILEETPQFGIGVGTPVAKLAAYLLVVGDIVRLASPIASSLNKVVEEITAKIGAAISDPTHDKGFCNLHDIMAEAMLYPTRQTNFDDIASALQEHASSFFEEIWVRRPSKALSGISPIDAAGHPAYHKRLLGLVKFVEDCYMSVSPRASNDTHVQIMVPYTFQGLRRKLGLPVAPGAGAPADEYDLRIDELSVAELADLQTDSLGEDQLDQAFRAAAKLDANELAGKFARDIVARPIGSSPTDRYAYFSHLIQLAHGEANADAILSLLEAGEKADLESNSGQRRNDYALRRGQMLAKFGEADRARQVLDELLAREPHDLKFFGPAAEAMLAAKKGDWALQFAEQGLLQARSQNNRDSEQYLMELAAAAKRMG
jgi:tetratricopeptide (TPR) repeat protein